MSKKIKYVKELNGLYNYKRRMPAAFSEYTDKTEIWLPIGKTLDSYPIIHGKVENAIEIQGMNYLKTEIKKRAILDLLEIEEFNVAKELEEKETEKLQYIIDSFVNRNSDNNSIAYYIRAGKLAVAYFGDVNINSIRFIKIQEFTNAIENMPKQHGKYRTMSFEELFKVKDVADEEKLSTATINKLLKFFKQILTDYENIDEDYSTPNFKKMESSYSERSDFEVDDLCKIMEVGGIVSVIASVVLKTGMRNSEIEKAVITNRKGYKVISLKKADTNKGTKNKSSQRYIPISDETEKEIYIIKGYIAQHSLEMMSKTFNKALRELGFDKSYVLYSLRHTFNTVLREKGVDKDIRERLMGHKGSQNDDYGSESMRMLKEAIDKIEICE